ACCRAEMSVGRPQSRGGMGPMPSHGGLGPVQATLRPGTQMKTMMPMQQGGRVPTSQGNRMGTAMRGPGSRNGLGTAAQGQPGLGVGALTDIKISDRPMTMQGVMGMKTGSLGPKRQIYDKTYYLVELRRRCQARAEGSRVYASKGKGKGDKGGVRKSFLSNESHPSSDK
ncbi:unnamed protein product, partial [Polarella glacialis]